MKDKTDEELVRLYNEGAERAFNELYLRYDGYVTSIANKMIQYDKSDLDDVVSEVWRKVVMSVGKFRYEAKFSTWLYQVTRSMVNTHLLKLKNDPIRQYRNLNYEDCVNGRKSSDGMYSFTENVKPRSELDVNDYHYLMSQYSTDTILTDSLEGGIEDFINIQNEVLRKFPKRYQTSYRLYLNGFSTNEVADLQEVPLGTAKSQIFTTRNAVIKAVKEHYENG